ncbi:haloacid dehalogenase [Lentzea sp. NBRC 105346]|uniref:HAD family hydrolase n=1 Tax=Lentzea sp. NBRC 105346 TaxID=3032205 RepID=UPI0024A02D22|nr:HAD family hydrolase [Lentzea sp. NBRC 105346]GLZ33661.1 haloacid dehalogenase [Lentzea sp. NBRC 105346]
MTTTVILDVDGTLVDTNYHHTVAWTRAFRRFDRTVPAWRIHRAIGMGGDKLVAAVAGDVTEREIGDDVRQAWMDEFDEFLADIQPLEGAHRLITAALEQHSVVLASSGKKQHVEHYLEVLDARDVLWTSADDVEDSKPDPDLIHVALRKASATRAVVIGDSVWDCEAATHAGLPSIGLLTGGFSRAELTDRGASAVYETLDDLRADLADLPFAEPA